MPSKQRTTVRQDRKARVEAMRAAERARERRQRFLIIGGGALVAVIILALVIVLPLATKSDKKSGATQVLPPSVGSGTARIEPQVPTAKNPTNIQGVVAYDTAGYPEGSNNGPVSKALPHNHVDGPIKYSVTPPVGGDHNGTWMNCGIYTQPVPSERAVHNLEHGAVWITYQPSLPAAEIAQLRAFVEKQSKVVWRAGNQSKKSNERFMDLTPFPGLSSPIVMSSWGYQLKLTSPTDPRMQQFVDTFRVNPKYSPEYGSDCSGGVGTPDAT